MDNAKYFCYNIIQQISYKIGMTYDSLPIWMGIAVIIVVIIAVCVAAADKAHRKTLRASFKWVLATETKSQDRQWLLVGDEIIGSLWGEEPPYTGWYKQRSVGEYLTIEAAKKAVEDRAAE